MESRTSKRNVDEGICCQDQDQDLGGSCDVVIHESPPCSLVHVGIDLAVDLPEEESFEKVEAYDEVHDEYYADNEGAERSETRY